MLIRKSVGSRRVRATLSRKGVSGSLGGRAWRLMVGGTGPRFTLRIPGTGISIQRRISRGR